VKRERICGEPSYQYPWDELARPTRSPKLLSFSSDDSSFVNGIELFVDGGMAQI